MLQYSRGSYVDTSGVGAAIVYRTAARISEFSDTLTAVLQISLRGCLQNSRESFKFDEYPRGTYVNKPGIVAAIVYRTAAQYSRGSYVDKSRVVAAIVYRTAARMSEFSDTLAAVLQISLCSCLQNNHESFKSVEYPRGSYVNKSGVAAATVYRTTARMSEFSDTLTAVLQISLRCCLQNSRESFKFVEYSRGSYVDQIWRWRSQVSTEQPRECPNFLTLSQLFCR